jgi:hypothetical protein
MPSLPAERRRESRCPIRVNVLVVGERERYAEARDINTGGMRLETDSPLPPTGKTCRLRFRLGPASALLAARARVLWARRVAPGLTQAGLAFVELPLTTQAAISRFMHAAAPASF